MPHVAAADHWNLERHLASDRRFDVRIGFAGELLYDFHDAETGQRQIGLLQYEALRLKNDADQARGRF
jgi:hypothetical protein